MPRKFPRLVWLAAPLAFVLYFYRLSAFGLLGPDEPRYASIAREMARSGDWVTPRLWGSPWFEKPALTYWLSGAGFRLGLGPELAPRLPVALLATCFLVFFWWIVKREFGCLEAGIATLILGTCGEWIGLSQVGTTDLPMTATFSAAMLLALPWLARREARFLPAASALLGLAVLAQGLLPLVLATPLLAAAWWFRRQAAGPDASAPALGDLIRPRVLAPFLVAALPWYALCYLRNGNPFLVEFIWRQQIGRFFSSELQHGQPWWYYAPVLAGAFLPWTAALPMLARREAYRDRRRLFLALWFLFGFVFFSVSRNKLGGYLLPLLPPLALLAGLAIAEAKDARGWLAACALLLIAYPVTFQVLPDALAWGLSRAPRPEFHWSWLLPGAAAALVWMLAARGKRAGAVAVVALGVGAGVFCVKQFEAARVDELASVRDLWSHIKGQAGDICYGDIRRDSIYGLKYYAGAELPDCSAQPRPLQLVQSQGHGLGIEARPRK